MSYVADLTLRLAAGATRLPGAFRRPHAAYLAAAQNADGGFSGRQGPSDLYYTSFALRSLALLGSLENGIADRAADFVRQQIHRPVGIADFVALAQSALVLELVTGSDAFALAGCDRNGSVSDYFRKLRRDDGGYAKTPHTRHSSTYATFLASSCLQQFGLPLDDIPAIAALVRSRRREDGGFVELAPLKHSGTNPTAAAVGSLRLLDGLDDETARRAAEFLVGMQSAEGGLRANTKIPVCDLLSTFTGLTALTDLGGLSQINLGAARRFVQDLAMSQGGFRGGVWDDVADVEYTFYGVATLALLAGPNG